ncbi:MAG: hypothetical protein U0168_08880 [Nannocystaceae bacterium]
MALEQAQQRGHRAGHDEAVPQRAAVPQRHRLGQRRLLDEAAHAQATGLVDLVGHDPAVLAVGGLGRDAQQHRERVVVFDAVERELAGLDEAAGVLDVVVRGQQQQPRVR